MYSSLLFFSLLVFLIKNFPATQRDSKRYMRGKRGKLHKEKVNEFLAVKLRQNTENRLKLSILWGEGCESDSSCILLIKENFEL